MGSVDKGDPNGTLFDKLRYLRFTHRGLNNRIHTYKQIAEHVTRVTDRRCSEKAIEYLFTPGATRYPSVERLAAILSLFGKTLGDLENRGDSSGTFGQRVAYLRHQFGQQYRHGKPPSLEEIASFVRTRTGRSCSPSYISQLMCGKATHGPAMDKIEALAAFFAVSPAFFFTDDLSRDLLDNERLLRAMDEFIEAIYELLQIRGGSIAGALGCGRPQRLDEFSRLTEMIRAEVDELCAERSLRSPCDRAIPG